MVLYTTHPPRKCPAYGKNCHGCGKANHYKSVCRSKNQNQSEQKKLPKINANAVTYTKNVHFDDTPMSCGSIDFGGTCISAITNGERQTIMAKLDIKPPDVKREVNLTVKADTGSNGNILPTRCFRQMYPDVAVGNKNLKPTTAKLTAVNDTDIPTYGTLTIPTSIDKSPVLDLLYHVCDTNGPAILSCDACERLGIVAVKKSRTFQV